MKSTKLILLSLLVLILVAINCQSENSQNPLDYPKSLIVVSGAMNVKYAKLNGMNQLKYKVFINYPASAIIQEIDTKLKKAGWNYLENDYMNPDIPTSHIRFWGSYIDGTKRPEEEVHVWSSDWRNQNGDIISYWFKYSYPVDKKPEFLNLNDLFDLDVVAVFVPSDMANSIIKQLNSLRNNK